MKRRTTANAGRESRDETEEAEGTRVMKGDRDAEEGKRRRLSWGKRNTMDKRMAKTSSDCSFMSLVLGGLRWPLNSPILPPPGFGMSTRGCSRSCMNSTRGRVVGAAMRGYEANRV